MKLIFIRHGQTDWNVRGKIQGSYDIELNETGIRQAIELSDKLTKHKYEFKKIYSSPQKRALNTAKILSDSSNIEYVVIDDLREINMGEWEGLSWKEVDENYPTEYKEWKSNRRYTSPPKGESYEDMLQRVIKALHKIINENKDDVVIITHSAVIMCLQCYITKTPFNKMLQFKTTNAEITEIDSKLLIQTFI